MAATLALTEVVHLPAPWVLGAAILAGAALAAATRRTPVASGPDREGAIARKWILFSLFLSGAVVLAMAAVFVPGAEKIASVKYPTFFLGGAILFGVVFRFPKTVGIAFVVVVLALVATLYLLMLALTPYRGDTEIARIVVYAAREGEIDVELRSPGLPDTFVRLEGSSVVPLARTAVFDDLWPILGWRRWYRLDGIQGDSGSVFHYERGEGVVETLYALFDRHAGRLPGVRLIRSEEDPPAPTGLALLEAYALILSEDGSARFAAAGP